MTKWLYHVEHLSKQDLHSNRLYDLGQDGWELVTLSIRFEQDDSIAVFKKPVIEETKHG